MCQKMKYSGTWVQISIQINPTKTCLSYIRTEPCTFDMTVRMLYLSLIPRIAGLKFCFWICARNKTSAIKGFHLASTGSYHLGCVPEFHSVHFVSLKQNMLTSLATCWVYCISNCLQISFPHAEQAASTLLQVGCFSVTTGSTTLCFQQVRGIPRKGKICLTSSPYQNKNQLNYNSLT